MDIVYQYYNEIVLAFADYEVDFKEGVITIQVHENKKPFNIVCEKIKNQIQKIADSLESRDKEVLITIKREGELEQLEFKVE